MLWAVFHYYANYGSVALHSHNTLKWSAILGLSFFAWCWTVAQGIHATGFKHALWTLHFTFKSANTLALCQSKATLPIVYFWTMGQLIWIFHSVFGSLKRAFFMPPTSPHIPSFAPMILIPTYLGGSPSTPLSRIGNKGCWTLWDHTPLISYSHM